MDEEVLRETEEEMCWQRNLLKKKKRKERNEDEKKQHFSRGGGGLVSEVSDNCRGSNLSVPTEDRKVYVLKASTHSFEIKTEPSASEK